MLQTYSYIDVKKRSQKVDFRISLLARYLRIVFVNAEC